MTFVSGQGHCRTYSRGGLYRDVISTADGFMQMGVCPGEHIIFALPNSYRLVCGFFGAIFSGAIPAIFPFNSIRTLPLVCQDLVQYPLVQTQGGRIVTAQNLAQDLSSQLAEFGLPVHSSEEINLGATSHAENFRVPMPAELAYMQLSSGTTGRPKGIYISHEGLMHHIEAVAKALSWRAEDISVGWAPFSHELGLILQVLLPAVAGGRSVNIEAHRWLAQPCVLPKTIDRFKGTVCFMPNFGFTHTSRRVCEEDLKGIDLSTLRVMGNGSEPIHCDSFEMFERCYRPYGFKAEMFAAAYGMAENAGAVTVTPSGRTPRVDWIESESLHRKKRAIPSYHTERGASAFVSCGRAIEGTSVRIVDPTGSALPERYVGEIVIRGSSLFQFYLDRKRPSQEIDGLYWFPTGDIGYLADGELYVCDRKQDVIIAGGINLFPDSIEAVAAEVMAKHTRRLVAFGVPIPHLGTECPVLICETTASLNPSEEAFHTAQLNRVILKKLGVAIADVRFVKRGWIVKSASGKLDRKANRRKYEESGFQRRSAKPIMTHQAAAPGQIEETLTALFQKRLGLFAVGAWDNFFDYGIDSLLFLDLFTAVEKLFEVELPLEEILRLPTIENLARQIIVRRSKDPAEIANCRDEKPEATSVKKTQSYIKRLKRVAGSFARHLNWNGWLYAFSSMAIQHVVRCTRFGYGIDADRVRQLKAFHALIRPSIPSEAFVRKSLINNCLSNWRLGLLAGCSPSVFNRWVSVEGLEILTAAIKKGGGVVLLQSHFAMHQIVLAVLHLNGFNEISVIGYNESLHKGPIGKFVPGGLGHISYAKHLSTLQLFEGKRMLTRGGIVSITADGEDGQSGFSLPFCGRMYPFRAGFAELSLQTGADPIPVITTMEITGHLRVQFLRPLDTGSAAQSNQVRMASLIEQYQCILERQWQQMPHNILWYYMRRFMSLPEVLQSP